MSRGPAIVVTARGLHPRAVSLLAQADAQVEYIADDAALRARLAGGTVDALIVRTMRIDATMIERSPRLRVISRHGAGREMVDVAAASRAGIPVLVAPGGNATSVAELAIGLMLALARGIPAVAAGTRAGGWDRTEPGLQLCGRSLGIIGFGAIGRAVAAAATALGMAVRVFDPMAIALPPSVERYDDLDALLAASDVVSLHCPLTDTTAGLINARRLALLPAGAMLVNTARGGLIDEPALLAALNDGALHGAALDTLVEEPPIAGNPLAANPRVIVTPHIGGNTDAALADVAIKAVAGALAILRGETVDRARCVNPETLAAENVDGR